MGGQHSEQKVTRRLLSPEALNQIVCYRFQKLEIDECNHTCIIQSKVSDFWIMESPNVYNVKVEIVNWTEYQISRFKGSQNEMDSSCSSCCCLLPLPFRKKQPKHVDKVDLTKMNLEIDDIERIENCHVTENTNISFDVMYKEITVRHSFKNAKWQISADHHSNVTYEYFELWPSEIYQVFLDETPGNISAVAGDDG